MSTRLRVITYHRILEPTDPAANPTLVSATPESFERQVRHLASRYRVVSSQEVLDALHGGRTLPPRAVLITFDDAYRDFGEIAWPILQHYSLPALLFVPTAHPDHPERAFWWDRLHHAFTRTPRPHWKGSPLGTLELHTPMVRQASIRRLQELLKRLPHTEAMSTVDGICAELGEPEPAERVLGWAELRTLALEGVTLGAHTRTHPVLTRVGLEVARAEISGSRADLARRTGTVPRVFCYPFGAHDEAVVALVAAAGFEMAVSCVRGQNRLESMDPLRLRRTNVTPRTTPWLFRMRLLRAVSELDGWRHRRRLVHRSRESADSPTFSPPSHKHNSSRSI